MNNPFKLVMCEGYAQFTNLIKLQNFATFMNQQANSWFVASGEQKNAMLGEFLRIEPLVPLVPLLNVLEFTSQVSQLQANQRAERETEDLNEKLSRKCINCNLKFKNETEFLFHIKTESHKEKKKVSDEAIANEFELEFKIVRDAPKENSFYKTYQSLSETCKKDLIGIEHVIELRDYNNANCWFMYCTLCCAPIITKHISYLEKHLMGIRHFLRYLKLEKPREFIRFKELREQKRIDEFRKLDFKNLFGAYGVNKNPILIYIELTDESQAAFRVKMGKILKPINLDENLEDFKKTIEKLPLEADGLHLGNQIESLLELIESLNCKKPTRTMLRIISKEDDKINETDIDEFVREQGLSKSDHIRLSYMNEQQSGSSLFEIADKNERMINEAIDCLLENKDISNLEKLQLFNEFKYKVENAVIIEEECNVSQTEAIAPRTSSPNFESNVDAKNGEEVYVEAPWNDLKQSPKLPIATPEISKSEKIEHDIQIKPDLIKAEPSENEQLTENTIRKTDVNNNETVAIEKLIKVVQNVISKDRCEESDKQILRIHSKDLLKKVREYFSKEDLNKFAEILKRISKK